MSNLDFFCLGDQDWPLEPTPMSPDEFLHEIIQAFETGGTDDGHAKADAIMCELLMFLGFDKGVNVFNAHTKWYS